MTVTYNHTPPNINNNCFEKGKKVTVAKKPLFLVFPYCEPLSLETRTKLRKSHKGSLNCCKLQIVFNSQNKLVNAFPFKDCIPKELTSGVVYKYQCGLCSESLMVNV